MENKNKTALRRAQERYKQKVIKRMYLELNKNTEMDIIEYLETLDNKTGYIKNLIREDMKKNL